MQTNGGPVTCGVEIAPSFLLEIDQLAEVESHDLLDRATDL